MKSPIKRSLLALAVAQALSHGVVNAATITVTSSADNLTNDGECTLREAITAANTNVAVDSCTSGVDGDPDESMDNIVFDNSLSSSTISVGADSLVITDHLSIDGDINGDDVPDITLDGGGILQGGKSGIIYSNTPNTVLNGLIIQNGKQTDSGAGIRINNGTFIGSNLIIKNNESANDGGGIEALYTTLTLNNSTISGNKADQGGGLYSLASTVNINGSTVSGNSADNDAGGTSFGGGLYLGEYSRVTIKNSTISGNSAIPNGNSSKGGGISVGSLYAFNVINSTITNNSADASTGGGLYFNVYAGRTTVITNSVIANNTNADCVGAVGVATNYIYHVNSLVGDGGTNCGTPTLTGDPELYALTDNGGLTQTHVPLFTSPLIDAGDNESCFVDFNITTDQRGIARDDGTCDIGATEFQIQTVQWSAATATVDESAGNITLTVNRTGDDLYSPLTVDYTSVSGTALSPSDYSSVSDTLTFGPDVASQTVTINITDDTNAEADAAFTVVLSNASTDVMGEPATLGSQTTTTVTITDTDISVNSEPTLTVTTSTPVFTENGSAVSLFSETSINDGDSDKDQNIIQLILTINNVTDVTESLIFDSETVALIDSNSGTTGDNGFGYSVSVSANVATVIISKNDTLIEYQTLIDRMKYTNNSDVPTGVTTRVVTLTSIKDSGGIVDGGDDTNNALNLSSTVTVMSANELPTGNVTISGTATQGQTLTAANTLADADGIGTISYQWQRGGSPIAGATSETYVLVQADVGNTMTVSASYTDGQGSIENVMSLATSNIIADLDGDGISDSTDTDIDGDGMDNDFEMANGLNPRDGSDASLDSDNDGLSNLEEFLASSNPNADDNPPVVTAPDDITLDATAFFTLVDLELATAVDELDGSLIPIADVAEQLRAGVHIVTWTATDAAGNVGVATQTVNIVPIVSLTTGQVVPEGSHVTVKVILNGDAIEYPVNVPYTISGTASFSDGSDHDLVDGNISITAPTDGELPEATIILNVVDDGVGEGTESIILTLGNPTNAVLGLKNSHTIDIIEGNVKPLLSLVARQANKDTLLIDSAQGSVEVIANTVDLNLSDTLTYDWSQSDNVLVDTDSIEARFTVDPTVLNAGFYKLIVVVSDGTESVTEEIVLNVLEIVPTLINTNDSDNDGIDDLAEGLGDDDNDGIPDYLDAIQSDNILQQLTGISDQFLMETEPGLKLVLGDIAFKANNGKAGVSETDVSDNTQSLDQVDTVQNIGGLFDFKISGIPKAGQSVQIVLAQLQAIPSNPVYRKLVSSGWQDFVEDANNNVASAPGEEGFCPSPGDSAYQSGLTEGHWCVQLTIEDGGLNDTDGVANNRVSDPGGVGSFVESTQSSSNGGGGSFNFWMLFLGFIGLCRFKGIKR